MATAGTFEYKDRIKSGDSNIAGNSAGETFDFDEAVIAHKNKRGTQFQPFRKLTVKHNYFNFSNHLNIFNLVIYSYFCTHHTHHHSSQSQSFIIFDPYFSYRYNLHIYSNECFY